MYPNLMRAMKDKKITYAQIAELLGCKYQTVSENIKGGTEKGIYLEDALQIWKVHFPEYDFGWLFIRMHSAA